jgi:hypothetical protein
VALVLGIPVTIVAYLIPESTYVVLYRTPKVFGFEFLAVCLVIYLCFVFGSFFAAGANTRSHDKDAPSYCRSFVQPLFLVTLFGYLAWFGYALLTSGIGPVFSELHDVLFEQEFGSSDELKTELFPNVPGVTTLTQVGMLYVTIESLLWVWKGSNRRAAIMRFAAIVFLAAFRSILLSERLALIEIVIPVVVVFTTTSQLRSRYKNLMRAAPMLLGFAVFAFFAVGEYFRSWTFFRPLYDEPYLRFAAERFVGYYATAANNAAVIYLYEPLHPLRLTFASLFEFPILGGYVSTIYAGVFGARSTYDTLSLFEKYANPEFNNVPLTGALVNDYSVFLAPVAAFVLGVFSATLYRSFLRGRLVGLLIYPSWFVGILELPRIYYWADVRYFPTLALLVLTLFAFALTKSSVRTSSGRKLSPAESRLTEQEF